MILSTMTRRRHSPPAAAALLLLLGACGKPGDAPRVSLAATATATAASTSTASPRAAVGKLEHSTLTASDTASDANGAAATGNAATALAAPGIAWLHASNGAEVDAAFARARQESKPVFVYWGAAWCPPCNQLKATLFNRQDFIARSRSFLPVYVDGDSAGAQKLGARFKVSGYPTMVLFSPAGTELTRLPGEVDAARYQSVLTLAMSASARPAAQVLAQALAGGNGLAADDWRLLAFYSWETDEQRLMPKGGLPALLGRLAMTCPAALVETSQRLRLQALAATGSETRTTVRPDPSAAASLLQLLGDEAAARAQMDLITNAAVDILHGATVAGTQERQRLATALDTALNRMEADGELSRADRMAALASRVELARSDDEGPAAAASRPAGRAPAKPRPPRLPQALLADVRASAARADREITDGYERQAVVTAAADVLDRAGLAAESDALLRANLEKSHSPYYLMSALARHAKERGDRADALHWYEAAYSRSEGPATRLQWGASYLGALVDLSPQDGNRIEATTAQLLREAAALPDAFDGRSARSLQRVGSKLQAWNQPGSRRASLDRLQAQLDGVCAGLPAGDPARANCEGLFKPAAKPKA